MNQIEIQFNHESLGLENVIRETVQTALDIFDIHDTFLEITFVTPEEIQTLNNKYRQTNKSTDVLSFPQVQILGAETRMLGNIVISKKMVDQKKEKLSDVIKHGLLHLLYFDHEDDKKSWVEAAQKINCNL